MECDGSDVKRLTSGGAARPTSFPTAARSADRVARMTVRGPGTAVASPWAILVAMCLATAATAFDETVMVATTSSSVDGSAG